jgi:hypothetical protein
MAGNESQPSFHILICLIQIWTLKDTKKPMEKPDSPRLIAEVEDIEIVDSYQKLTGTAIVRFPKGTVIKKTVTEINQKEISDRETEADSVDYGMLEKVRVDSKMAQITDFNPGDRIRIMLGYTRDPEVAALTKTDKSGQSIFNNSDKLAEYMSHLTTMFDGYIVKRSVNTPVELRCENLASVLKKITCPKVIPSKNMTVNDFLSENGKWNLLKDSGLKLHPVTESCDINIGKTPLTTDLTVADVLTQWSKHRVFCYVKYANNEPCIAVGRSYFSNPGKDSILNKEFSGEPETIHFDYHVAEDNLTLMENDENFLAVEATSYSQSTNQFYHITIRLNPDYDRSDPKSLKYQVLNETTLSKKMQKAGATVFNKSKDRVDLSKYTIIPYMSRKMNISHEELVNEAKQYFESYNRNGVDGQLTIFGDLKLQTGSRVELADKRNGNRDGYYLVDEVVTRFGVKGFRQTIKLPYLIAKKKKNGNDE